MHGLTNTPVGKLIEGGIFDPDAYSQAKLGGNSTVRGVQNNRVLCRGPIAAKLDITFSDKARQSTVLLNGPLEGSVRIRVSGHHSLIYIGAECRLQNLQLNSQQNHDRILVGSGVTCTGTSAVSSGMNAGSHTPHVVIGDDVMLSHGISIRNTDAHPVLSLDTLQQINGPRSGVVIEPHVWVGQDCSILKDVNVGACSIVALGSVVTKDVPRFSLAAGVPARSVPKAGAVWARGMAPRFVERAKYHAERWSDG